MNEACVSRLLRTLACVVVAALPLMPVLAAAPSPVQGLWLTAAKDAVIAFAPCTDAAGAMCGKVVWDKDAGTPKDTCGVQIARLERDDNGTWRDGWAFDPRSGKRYKATLRSKGDSLTLRAFIGAEVLGENMLFTRVQALPSTPVCASH
ncbi:DUF2147 domain-containing protein [Xanthomonas axonopodis pv. begoniae]|uniref:DUF2147 domain-containing protein n=1 Tax=Xanthomonas phaseoli TaxID=1985254 RepID=UPI000CEF2F22|nr:DUF2147 domain-containing protein [Xanthomonas phaseoli]MBO9739703.1 DUF2147 domain-containing protein [Xanthomonas axonopodis pv. begoniae]MBO9770550.1 DUF2147 domain-containing protein [Xanthomonas axonopodis pv. begoniae]MCC8469324.1 DUF2147 domain-containing protein [Xanthomonas phaseoli]PPT33065.1 hypothetical protein XabCFBP2524_19245 [Xanthomonas axonopodis pv. begoniae]